jgi:phosphodiesterase/alkaline phosphatase D-like protein
MKPQKILGPFLMRPTSSSMGFWMASGPQTNVQFKIQVFQEAQLLEKLFANKLVGSCLGVSLAETSLKLKPDTKYAYHCLADDIPIFEGKFRTLPEKMDLPFYFVSCNGIAYYEWHHPDKDAWKVWKIIQEEVEIDIAAPLMLMCGDQVYMDIMFQEDIKRINEFPDDIIWEKIYDVYFAHWKDYSYLKVLGQVPSFMMGDDHDFLDGFGSREEQFNANGESSNWQHYRRFVTQAFWEMQAVRNGEKTSKSFLWQKKIGNAHFVMPDLRSERNFFKHQMLSYEQKATLENYIDSQVKRGETLYFISTVTLGRMGRGAEIFLSNFSNYLWRLNSWLGRDSFSLPTALGIFCFQ